MVSLVGGHNTLLVLDVLVYSVRVVASTPRYLLGEEAVVVEPTEAITHYNLACYLSLAGEKARSLAHLAEALVLDPTYRALVDDEPDFDPIRSDAQFQAITSIIV